MLWLIKSLEMMNKDLILTLVFFSLSSLSKAFLLSNPSPFHIRSNAVSKQSGFCTPVQLYPRLQFGRPGNQKTQSALWRASSTSSEAELYGIYSWSYSGGSFPVELRSGGNFYCKSYPAAARWELVGNIVKVDWKKYGKYELEVYLI